MPQIELRVVCVVACIICSLNEYVSAMDIRSVEAAWKDSWKNVESFEFRCQLKKTNFTEPSADPFVPQASGGNGVTTNTETVFSFSNNKIAYHQTGDKVSSATFNGQEYRHLLKGARYMHGRIHETDEPKALIANIDTLPLLLAFRPLEALSRIGYSVDQMQIVRDMDNKQGTVRIKIPSTKGSGSALISVDPLRGMLPIECSQLTRDGAVVATVTLDFVPNETVGWTVSSWDYKVYAGGTNLLMQLIANVTHCDIGTPIPDAEFELGFPEGARITKK